MQRPPERGACNPRSEAATGVRSPQAKEHLGPPDAARSQKVPQPPTLGGSSALADSSISDFPPPERGHDECRHLGAAARFAMLCYGSCGKLIQGPWHSVLTSSPERGHCAGMRGGGSSVCACVHKTRVRAMGSHRRPGAGGQGRDFLSCQCPPHPVLDPRGQQGR